MELLFKLYLFKSLFFFIWFNINISYLKHNPLKPWKELIIKGLSPVSETPIINFKLISFLFLIYIKQVEKMNNMIEVGRVAKRGYRRAFTATLGILPSFPIFYCMRVTSRSFDFVWIKLWFLHVAISRWIIWFFYLSFKKYFASSTLSNFEALNFIIARVLLTYFRIISWSVPKI